MDYMDTKKAVIAGLVTLVGIGGIAAGAMLLQRNTELRELAAVPGGRASVSLLPESGSFDIGDTFPVSIYFNTDNIAISVVSATVKYPYSGSTPEVTASDVTINPTFTGSPDWSCPESSVDEANGEVLVTVSCSNVGSATGFSTGTDTLLATFNLTVNRNPTQVPFSISFDPSSSRILQKSNNQDILGIPSSVGSYTIGGATGGPTATTAPSTTISPTTTGTVTATPTKKATTTPTKVSSSSSSPSTLPNAGVSLPTVLGIGLGILAIFGSLAVAL